MEQDIDSDLAGAGTCLVFTNPGEIDPRAITTLGVNVKPAASGSPIGYFGTGLKFAISTWLRHGCRVQIMSGDRVMEFVAIPETIRGEEFQIVQMVSSVGPNEHTTVDRLGFTTGLGRDWKPWMALRELWSNSKDEGGDGGRIASSSEDLRPIPGQTQVIISGPAAIEAFEAREDWLLTTPDESEPLWAGAGVEVWDGTGTGVFYHGIRVASSGKPTLYTWNLVGAQRLTEDRTLGDWDARRTIVASLIQCPDQYLLETILGAETALWEHGLDFDYASGEASPEFLAAVRAVSDREEFNRSAKRWARARYEAEFLPRPQIMSGPQRARCQQGLRLIARLGLEHPWTRTYRARLDLDYDWFQHTSEALYFSDSALDGDEDEFLERLVEYVLDNGTDWKPRKAARALIRLVASGDEGQDEAGKVLSKENSDG